MEKVSLDNGLNFGDHYTSKLIQKLIQQLMGKKILSLQFISAFLDVRFFFEDEYELTTFFNLMEEDQWTIFLPNDSNVSINCSNKQSIKKVQNIANKLQVVEFHKKQNFISNEPMVLKIILDDYYQPEILLSDKYSIILKYCAWRLEKDGNYLIGCLDHDANNIILQLIGKKLKQIYVTNSMMDAIFQFDDNFILKTFTSCNVLNQWKIFSDDLLIFDAKIERNNI